MNMKLSDKDSEDTVFTAISTGAFDNYAEAEAAVTLFYIPDMNFTRAGICAALKRLKIHYETTI